MAYDLDFRPRSYWDDESRARRSRIKGTMRRRLAEQGVPEEALIAEGQDPWGHINPAFMGGEYLPDAAEDEVEIARVDLASTTGDAISIRAVREGELIRYRVVDEYGTTYAVNPGASQHPLTMGELIGLMDTARGVDGDDAMYPEGAQGLTDVWRDFNLDGYEDDPAALLDFVRVSSAFYPEIDAYYEAEAQAWLDRLRKD